MRDQKAEVVSMTKMQAVWMLVVSLMVLGSPTGEASLRPVPRDRIATPSLDPGVVTPAPRSPFKGESQAFTLAMGALQQNLWRDALAFLELSREIQERETDALFIRDAVEMLSRSEVSLQRMAAKAPLSSSWMASDLFVVAATNHNLALCFLATGRLDHQPFFRRSQSAYRWLLRGNPDHPRGRVCAAALEAALGSLEAVPGLLGTSLTRPTGDYLQLMDRAHLYSVLGDSRRALEALGLALVIDCGSARSWMVHSHDFDALQENPGFKQLLADHCGEGHDFAASEPVTAAPFSW